MEAREPEAKRYRIEALAKGLQVLTAFDGDRRSLKTGEISAQLGLPTATTFRIIATLEEFGFLERLADGGFQPGIAALRLGRVAARSSSLLDASERPLRALADSTGETVNLGVLTGDRVLYLARLRNTDLLTANVQVGTTLPAPYTSMGKMLLSYLDEAEVRRRVTDDSFINRPGPRAVQDVDELCERLDRVRRVGYAVQDEELARGLKSVAVGVETESGVPVAAVNIAVATETRDIDSLVGDFLQPLRDAARDIAMRLEN